MGGAKKRSLAQAEKQQDLQTTKVTKTEKKKGGAKSGKAESKEKTSGFSAQNITEKDLKELSSLKALTPYAVSTKFGVRQSIAKDILESLVKKKYVQQIASGRGIKVYKVLGSV